jgi:hypothetical protein
MPLSIQEAIEILTQYNLWRRNDNVPNSQEMPDPKKLGIAIDKALDAMKWIIALGGNAQQ